MSSQTYKKNMHPKIPCLKVLQNWSKSAFEESHLEEQDCILSYLNLNILISRHLWQEEDVSHQDSWVALMKKEEYKLICPSLKNKHVSQGIKDYLSSVLGGITLPGGQKLFVKLKSFQKREEEKKMQAYIYKEKKTSGTNDALNAKSG